MHKGRKKDNAVLTIATIHCMSQSALTTTKTVQALSGSHLNQMSSMEAALREHTALLQEKIDEVEAWEGTCVMQQGVAVFIVETCRIEVIQRLKHR